jgi:hypothetical protein
VVRDAHVDDIIVLPAVLVHTDEAIPVALDEFSGPRLAGAEED